MQLKVQHLMDATLVLRDIVLERRSMPQRGKFKVARMHAKLLVDFDIINAQRDEMIMRYGVHETTEIVDPETGSSTTVETPEWKVPPERMAEFTAAWREIADDEIEVDVTPIPLADLDCGNGNGEIEARELIVLGELVAEWKG